MKKLFLLLLVMCFAVSCGNEQKKSDGKETMETDGASHKKLSKLCAIVDDLCPGEMWDGYSLIGVDLAANEVRIKVNCGDRFPDELYKLSDVKKKKFGIFLIENFKEAYDYLSVGEEGEEGDADLLLEVYPLLEEIVEADLPLVFKISDSERKKIEIELSVSDIQSGL